MKRILAALICAATATAAPAQKPPETDASLRARELRVLREGEAKFQQALAEFNKLLAEKPAPGTSARTRLAQTAAQLNDSAGELKSRFDFASRTPQNREELSTLKRPWERFLSEQSPAVRDLVREGRALARTASPLPGGPASSPTPAQQQQDIDLATLSRDIGVPLGKPVTSGSPDALPVPPGPQKSTAPDARSTSNVYFAVVSQAYRTYDEEWKTPECRYRIVHKTRTNYGSRSEAEGDATRMRSQGYADAEARYFETWQAMDAFIRDWEKRRAADSRICGDAYAQARQRAKATR